MPNRHSSRAIATRSVPMHFKTTSLLITALSLLALGTTPVHAQGGAGAGPGPAPGFGDNGLPTGTILNPGSAGGSYSGPGDLVGPAPVNGAFGTTTDGGCPNVWPSCDPPAPCVPQSFSSFGGFFRPGLGSGCFVDPTTGQFRYVESYSMTVLDAVDLILQVTNDPDKFSGLISPEGNITFCFSHPAGLTGLYLLENPALTGINTGILQTAPASADERVPLQACLLDGSQTGELMVRGLIPQGGVFRPIPGCIQENGLTLTFNYDCFENAVQKLLASGAFYTNYVFNVGLQTCNPCTP